MSLNWTVFFQFWPVLMEELSELREFYDPDTVELMTWIRYVHDTHTHMHSILESIWLAFSVFLPIIFFPRFPGLDVFAHASMLVYGAFLVMSAESWWGNLGVLEKDPAGGRPLSLCGWALKDVIVSGMGKTHRAYRTEKFQVTSQFCRVCVVFHVSECPLLFIWLSN